jgi:APA family basic amino acid/polyamine antiporter
MLGASFLHFGSVSFGARIQAAVVVAEVVLITLFASFGLGRLYPDGFHSTPTPGHFGKLGLALVLVSFSYLGWNGAVYIGGEVKDPEAQSAALAHPGHIDRDDPVPGLERLLRLRGARIGAGGAHRRGARGGRGRGRSGLGRCGVGAGRAGAGPVRVRVDHDRPAGGRAHGGRWFAAARFRGVGRATAASGLLAQLSLGLLALWTATFERILTYVGFTLGISMVATIIGLCRLRLKEGPSLHVPGWPWVPGLFLAFVVGSTIFTVVQRPFEGLVGLATLGLGVVAYFVQQQTRSTRPTPR